MSHRHQKLTEMQHLSNLQVVPFCLDICPINHWAVWSSVERLQFYEYSEYTLYVSSHFRMDTIVPWFVCLLFCLQPAEPKLSSIKSKLIRNTHNCKKIYPYLRISTKCNLFEWYLTRANCLLTPQQMFTIKQGEFLNYKRIN